MVGKNDAQIVEIVLLVKLMGALAATTAVGITVVCIDSGHPTFLTTYIFWVYMYKNYKNLKIIFTSLLKYVSNSNHQWSGYV